MMLMIVLLDSDLSTCLNKLYSICWTLVKVQFFLVGSKFKIPGNLSFQFSVIGIGALKKNPVPADSLITHVS